MTGVFAGYVSKCGYGWTGILYVEEFEDVVVVDFDVSYVLYADNLNMSPHYQIS